MRGNPSRFRSPTRPVEQVNFPEVQEFLDRLNALVPGLGLSLPSEAQWEYACRAGTDRATYAGDMLILGETNAPVLDAIAWYGGNSGVDFELEGEDSSSWRGKQYEHTRAGTRVVAQKVPNAWGLYDMLGNVWEWCADHWHASYIGAPTDGSAWVDLRPGSAVDRVVRGGSWHDFARDSRAACRFHEAPSRRDDDIGFRCIRPDGAGSKQSVEQESPMRSAPTSKRPKRRK
jgi:formylglycine-generating enzyme required for sulfatase activity